jgi:uncharacterized membrane protein YjgN (DUF898 family)
MGIGGAEKTAIEFEGDIHGFIPIALTNTLLNIVTLGFYRFWATTRERKFFWGHTRVIDDNLEWTGTGGELFKGFLLALVLLGVPFFILNLVAQGAILQGQPIVAGLVGLFVYLFFFAIVGFAVFRGLRYRLSRTYWHGIHGGSDDNGMNYGLTYIWKTIVGALPLGLLVPWSMTSLWKDRWTKMSFGPHKFESEPRWQDLMLRYVLCYLLPFIVVIVLIVVAGKSVSGSGPTGAAGAFVGLAILSIYVILPILVIAFYAAYAREVIGSLSLSTLKFQFKAKTLDWILMYLGNFGIQLLAFVVAFILAGIFGGLGALAAISAGGAAGQDPSLALQGLGIGTVILTLLAFIIPLALVAPFIRYRTWAFLIRHMEIGGEINLSQLTQSETDNMKQGEGLLDAMDMGAI